ncbi:GNAT family N-acetyltransferase [Paracoccus homiensis]|uniref:Protein N-acetyltransferase, RimJ/RimL family n=1 Tax=Paracoccus homiensis TaxID=364199 RepID=A0A1I0CLQ3_9RHOB|nr:GNAT family N-acetyltransferase [Paracoccus homiensis]SET20500.1 Protein N-acetyltransferase, RimJ/RimL family [Paracoccus homiensis]
MRDRISLGRPYPDDIDSIVAAMRDPDVSGWLTSVPAGYGPDDAAQFIAVAGADEYAIRVDGDLAGMLRAGSSFGIWVMPGYQRSGVGLRASVLGLSRYFRDSGAAHVRAVYLDGNHRSAALLARLGFQDRGATRTWSRARQADLPGRSLRLSRADFEARHQMRLITPRLVIDGYRDADAPALHGIVTRPAVARMLQRFRPDMTVAEVAALFTAEALWPPLRLVARYRGQVIGSVGVTDDPVPALRYFIDPDHAEQGLGQEMVGAFLSEYVARFDPPAFQAEVFDDNPASMLILRNLGFQRSDDVSRRSPGRDGEIPAGVFHWRRRGGA